MSLAEQALHLLDIDPSIRSRQNPENFTSLDQTIVASLPGTEAPEERAAAAPAQPSPFSLASRMNRSNHEDQLRAEALTQALRQIRASNASPLFTARRPARS
jgi:hypothetical protein